MNRSIPGASPTASPGNFTETLLQNSNKNRWPVTQAPVLPKVELNTNNDGQRNDDQRGEL